MYEERCSEERNKIGTVHASPLLEQFIEFVKSFETRDKRLNEYTIEGEEEHKNIYFFEQSLSEEKSFNTYSNLVDAEKFNGFFEMKCHDEAS